MCLAAVVRRVVGISCKILPEGARVQDDGCRDDCGYRDGSPLSCSEAHILLNSHYKNNLEIHLKEIKKAINKL